MGEEYPAERHARDIGRRAHIHLDDHIAGRDMIMAGRLETFVSDRTDLLRRIIGGDRNTDGGETLADRAVEFAGGRDQ